MNRYWLALFTFVMLSASGFRPKPIDVFDEVVTGLKSGNAHLIALKLTDPVELDIDGTDEVYSRNQGEMILHEFLIKNPVRNVLIQHRGNSNGGARFANGFIETTKGNFRFHMLARQTPIGLQIGELRIERQ